MKYTRNARDIRGPASVIGLTGGIGSGKTVATDALIAAGFTVVDADEVSRAMFARGTDGERAILSAFPDAVTQDGALDRKKLRALIAADSKARKTLDDMTHPEIIAEVKRLIAAAPKPVVLSAPLLFETALSALCDCVVCIVCPRRTRIARLTARDEISVFDAQRIIDAQLPDHIRATLADYCVPSDVDRSDFEEEITELFNALSRENKTPKGGQS